MFTLYVNLIGMLAYECFSFPFSWVSFAAEKQTEGWSLAIWALKQFQIRLWGASESVQSINLAKIQAIDSQQNLHISQEA